MLPFWARVPSALLSPLISWPSIFLAFLVGTTVPTRWNDVFSVHEPAAQCSRRAFAVSLAGPDTIPFGVGLPRKPTQSRAATGIIASLNGTREMIRAVYGIFMALGPECKGWKTIAGSGCLRNRCGSMFRLGAEERPEQAQMIPVLPAQVKSPDRGTRNAGRFGSRYAPFSYMLVASLGANESRFH